jgi:hypothetical protein
VPRSGEDCRGVVSELSIPPWVPFSDITAERVEWVVPGVPRGMLTLLAGPPKTGKSLLTARWAAELSYQGEPSVLVSAEDSPSHVTKARLQALEANEALIHYSPGFTIDPSALQDIVTRTEQLGPSLIVLDPFTAMMPGDISSWSDQHVRSLLSPMADIAQVMQVAIVYVLHLNKRSSGTLIDRIGGSIGFAGAARSILGMSKDDTMPERRLLGHICNVAEAQPTQVYEIKKVTIPSGTKEPDYETAKLHYAGLSERDADSLYEGHGEDAGELDACMTLLADRLALGEVTSAEIDAMLRANGVSKATELRARKALGVQAVQKGRRWVLYL